ncbi:unnamed protein product [Phyllotreta striolata]|uniref:SUN domain-containing protein n=1 Tax=Phyllotreta striolata TaxID=444603 RepID=A0A9N9TXM9_PHYSR|nr:unnamed protein product [Phyllotreta striolata]
MNLDPRDFVPDCASIRYGSTKNEKSSTTKYVYFTTLCISAVICIWGIYYWSTIRNMPKFEYTDIKIIEPVRDYYAEIEQLKQKIDSHDEMLRKYHEELYKEIYNSLESAFHKQLHEITNSHESDSDKIGLFDYAAQNAGGSVHSTPDTIPYPTNKSVTLFGLFSINIVSNPENLLQPDNFPGNCFAFVGRTGTVRVKLGKRIVVRAVGIDHIRFYGDRSSAPKDFGVYGMSNDDGEESGKLLGKFSYDINGRSVQTFRINNDLSFEYVELRVLSNHGKREFTCVYRFRVHDAFL